MEQVYWRYEDQLNSCVGQIDENGWRTMQNSYLAFGEVMQSRVLYDGAVSRLSAVEYDGLALTTIRLANNDLSTDLLNGALLFLARPGYNGNRHMEAVVVDSTANSIVVEDLTGDLFEALGPEGRPIAGFVIFAFNDSKQANAPTYQTQGTWTSAPSFASSQTTFTDVDADDNGGGFASWMIGAILVPDVNIGAPLIITGATATTLTVAGDARGVASSGSQYIVYAAPFTDPVRGTWQTDVHKGGTRYLWAGYRYQPPQMGFWVDPPGAAGLGVYGAATGSNRLGQYYCWNRTYDINLGRWTTPDPVATPWWNLWDYARGNVIPRSDGRGLATPENTLEAACKKCDIGGLMAWTVGLFSKVYDQARGIQKTARIAGDLAKKMAEGGETQALQDELAARQAKDRDHREQLDNMCATARRAYNSMSRHDFECCPHPVFETTFIAQLVNLEFALRAACKPKVLDWDFARLYKEKCWRSDPKPEGEPVPVIPPVGPLPVRLGERVWKVAKVAGRGVATAGGLLIVIPWLDPEACFPRIPSREEEWEKPPVA